MLNALAALLRPPAPKWRVATGDSQTACPGNAYEWGEKASDPGEWHGG